MYIIYDISVIVSSLLRVGSDLGMDRYGSGWT
jgi:hypothetical protein